MFSTPLRGLPLTASAIMRSRALPKGRAEKGNARDDDTNAVMLRCARKGASLKRCTLFILSYIKI